MKWRAARRVESEGAVLGERVLVGVVISRVAFAVALKSSSMVPRAAMALWRCAVARKRVRTVARLWARERRASPWSLARKRERWSRVVLRVAATSWRDLVGFRRRSSRCARGKGSAGAGGVGPWGVGSGWAVRATMWYGECTA